MAVCVIANRKWLGQYHIIKLQQSLPKYLVQTMLMQLNLLVRAYHRILKLARAIADLAGSDEIQSPHPADALQYRPNLMMG